MARLFAPLAGAIAFVVTCAEYSRHLVDRSQVLKRALEAGFVTFVFFLIVPPLLIWLFLTR